MESSKVSLTPIKNDPSKPTLTFKGWGGLSFFIPERLKEKSKLLYKWKGFDLWFYSSPTVILAYKILSTIWTSIGQNLYTFWGKDHPPPAPRKKKTFNFFFSFPQKLKFFVVFSNQSIGIVQDDTNNDETPKQRKKPKSRTPKGFATIICQRAPLVLTPVLLVLCFLMSYLWIASTILVSQNLLGAAYWDHS